MAPDAESPNHVYDIFGASCVEVEMDALTGNYVINRMDVLYDCGVRCVNPFILSLCVVRKDKNAHRSTAYCEGACFN